jgi:hypothetical protein
MKGIGLTCLGESNNEAASVGGLIGAAKLYESGTFVKFTPAGAELFA